MLKERFGTNRNVMKILFVSQYFYPETFKGNDLVFDFVKRGHDVTVLTGKPNYPEGKYYKGYGFLKKRTEIIQGAKIIRTPIYPRRNGKGIHLILNYLSFVFFSYFTHLFRIKGNYDLIFVQQLSPVSMAFPGIWLKKKFNIPLYLWVLDLWPESVLAASNYKNPIIIRFVESIVKKIYNQSDVILISSRNFEKSIKEKLLDKNKEMVYFPNWAEDIFIDNELEGNFSIPDLPKGFNIMFAGNVGESQDFETIIKAAELTSIHNINWIIVGEGRKLDWIKIQLSLRKVENVFLLGRHPIEMMPYFFSKADVMLVSLKSDSVFSITVPAKIQAYMASSKIILGSLNGEGNTIINESCCGSAVSAGNPKLLSEKAIFLKELPQNKIKEMKDNARMYYESNFSKKTLFDSLERNFKKKIRS
jgi:glycosyltransferase involved in cell wall biosynthesis